MSKQLGFNLKVERLKKHMTQKELSEHIGISARTISRYELNQANPKEKTLMKFAEFFGKTIEQLK
ncbi:helix-turn-helix transcriptional regulator [Cytobacillus sp. FSL W7-1323]|uniref:helix-turn-helix transcriptional regulator n=1 Tax=Cytobacillus TaxID=2675230 RepID=UPI001CD530A9|nr:helix-turn-helix transcriptional regulator [Cytobacillus kochii]MCA1026690.1 helix-turn-helix domain-containing protein [Cytobacillus kochii]MDM5209165.1 helix-turn-helix transcriptional regulator [Cytobacillus kochii]